MPPRSFFRYLDVALALALVPVALFLCAGLWVLNPIFNPGSLVFRQARVGRGGAIFVMYKFRTLDACGRATRFAAALRSSRLDEVPQILNILLGQMAFVGPRPLTRREVGLFRLHIPGFDRREVVLPGITGLAQLRQGHTSGIAAARKKLAWDRLYLRRKSTLVDLGLLLATLLPGLHFGFAPTAKSFAMDWRRALQ